MSSSNLKLPQLPPGWRFSKNGSYYFVVLGEVGTGCTTFCVDEIQTIEGRTDVYHIESGVLDKNSYIEQFEDFTGYASMQEALDAMAILLWCRHQEFEQQLKGFLS